MRRRSLARRIQVGFAQTAAVHWSFYIVELICKHFLSRYSTEMHRFVWCDSLYFHVFWGTFGVGWVPPAPLWAPCLARCRFQVHFLKYFRHLRSHFGAHWGPLPAFFSAEWGQKCNLWSAKVVARVPNVFLVPPGVKKWGFSGWPMWLKCCK